jgi:hypothetical protein
MTRLPIDARPPHIRDADNQREDEALRKITEESLETLNLINALRREEGHSVTLFCDNPDFSGPNNAIAVNGDWTDWKDRRFTGDTLLTALRAAHAMMNQNKRT